MVGGDLGKAGPGVYPAAAVALDSIFVHVPAITQLLALVEEIAQERRGTRKSEIVF